MPTTTEDIRILQEALDARLLGAIEFASILAEIDSLELPADEYLVQCGLITEEQRQCLLGPRPDNSDAGQTRCMMPARGSRKAISNPGKQVEPERDEPELETPEQDEAEQEDSKTAATPNPRTPKTNQQRYERLEEFARGGLGAVWKARDALVDRPVAIKEILPKVNRDPAMIESFVNEARITGKLQHPGIVPIYDLGENQNESPFYVMRFIDGNTLHEAIQSHHNASTNKSSDSDKQLSLRQLLEIFLSICRTMHYAHDKGYIHRDLKPRNVMLGNYGETLVVDWGLACPFSSNEVTHHTHETLDIRSGSGRSNSSRKTRSRKSSRQVLGTPSYMAPEQAAGDVDLMDSRSDVFSLGCILFEILTGEPPYDGNDSNSIIDSVKSGNFPQPIQLRKRLPKAMNSVCVKATRYCKEDRYQSAQELANDVERYLAGDRVLSHPESPIERLQRSLVKHSETTVIAFCSLILLSIITGVAAFSINKARAAERTARIEALEARDAEAEARQQENNAKRAAVDNLRSALDAVDTWLLQLSADLEFYPGLSEKRDELLAQAETYYGQLTETKTDDLALEEESARASIRLGDVRQLSGQYKLAGATFDQAIAWFQDQARLAPEKARYKKELANALIGRAIVASKQTAEQDFKNQDALLLLDDAEHCLHELAVTSPSNEELQYALARLEVARGRLLSGSEAIDQLENARRRLVDLSRQQNPKTRHVSLYQTTLFELTQRYSDQRAWEPAEEIAREAIRHFDSLVQQSPMRPDLFEGRMCAYILRGNIRRQSQGDGALADYASAEADYHRLVSTLHRGEYHSENLVVANLNRAQMLLAKDELEPAEKILRMTRDEAAHLIQLHGQQPHLLRLFVTAKIELSELDIRRSRFDQAMSGAKEAVLILEHMKQHDDGDETTRRLLGQAYFQLAKLEASSGELREAKLYIAKPEFSDANLPDEKRRAHELCRKLVEILELAQTDQQEARTAANDIADVLSATQGLEPISSRVREILNQD